MATIQINDQLFSAAKAYREAFLSAKAEEPAEFDQDAQESEPFYLMTWFLYQLAEAVIHTEKAEG